MTAHTRKYVAAAILALGAGAALWWQRPQSFAPLTEAVSGREAPAAPKAKTGRRAGGPPATVEAATARAARTTEDIRTVGSLQSDEAVQIAPEITGRVSEILFAEGALVRKGAPLVRLDDALARAELQQAKARLAFATANNDRALALAQSGNVTERSRDEAKANYETAIAEVELATTRLAKHELRAPFDGTAGVRRVSVGAYLAPGTPIVNLEKIDRLKVDFKVPEIYLEGVRVGQKVEVHVDALPSRTFPGEIYAINPLIDVNGRALQVRARLDNAGLLLRPGLFARVVVKGVAERDVVMVPESAILPRGGDSYVFRVDGDRVSEVRVKLGARGAGDVEILEGLSPGAVVVTAGQQKLRDGAAVEIVPDETGPPPAATGFTPRTVMGGSG